VNAEQMMEHANAHGVHTSLTRRADGWTATALDATGNSLREEKEAKHGRDAMEQVLCVVSFNWEDKDRAAAFRVAMVGE
jgi:hypothetical protein